jgi:hypothetical protein
MKPSDKAKFVETLMGLSAVKPGKELSREGIEIFWLAMQDWTLEQFKAAASHLARTVEFMPNPFHFEQLRKQGELTPGEAWERALAWARSGGHRGGPMADPSKDPGPQVGAAVAILGGYEAIAMSPQDKTCFLERRFCEHFEQIQDAHSTRAALPQIAADPRVRRLIASHSTEHPHARTPKGAP